MLGVKECRRMPSFDLLNHDAVALNGAKRF